MGFLDKNTRVIDLVLTDLGRELYSKGELEFEYYAFSDDEVDYDPYIADSGSMTEVQLAEAIEEQIEATIVNEALFGFQDEADPRSRDQTNIQNLLFTMPQGQKIIPEMQLAESGIGDARTISLTQQKVIEESVTRNQDGTVIEKVEPREIGMLKRDPDKYQIDFDINDFFAKESRDGFLIRVFESGSDGLREIAPKRDKRNVMSYSGDLMILRDVEVEQAAKEDSKVAEAKTSTSISRKV